MSPRKARSHWRKVRRQWQQEAKAFIRKVRAIEDINLRNAVACIVELTTNDAASFIVNAAETEGEGQNFSIEGVAIDEEYEKILVEKYGTDTLEAAHDWIMKRVHHGSMGFFVYAFGSMQLHEDLLQMGEKEVGCVSDGIVISITRNMIVGIHRGGNPLDGKNIEPIPND